MEIEWDSSQDPDMRGEYDFIDGVRGKYADGFARGSNVVVLDPDLATEFKTRKAVNALRAQLKNERVPLEMTADSDECDDGEGDKDDLHEGKGSSQ